MTTLFKRTRIFANFENKRVRKLFEQVWENLPEADQRMLEAELVNLSDIMWLSGEGTTIYDPSIRTIQVRGEDLEQMDDHMAMYIIAWTLAHALRNKPGKFEMDEGDDEDADVQAEVWGFPRPRMMTGEVSRN
jgi:hypothetical protein